VVAFRGGEFILFLPLSASCCFGLSRALLFVAILLVVAEMGPFRGTVWTNESDWAGARSIWAQGWDRVGACAP